jgi:hypothetical protein
MRQFSIKAGSREVVISEDLGRFTANLYVNNGETITGQRWTGKSEAGARRWAEKTLAAHVGGTK